MGDNCMNKNILNILTICLLGSILFFTGCVEEETEIPIEKPLEKETVIEYEKDILPTLEPTLPSGYTWYNDVEFGYKIIYPESWEKNIPVFGEGIEGGVLFEDPDKQSTISILIASEYDMEGLKAEGGKDVLINGREGYEVILQHLPPVKIKLVAIVVDNKYYVISCTSPSDFFNENLETFDAAINSFIVSTSISSQTPSEPIDTWPKYMVTFNCQDYQIDYVSGQKETITQALTSCIITGPSYPSYYAFEIVNTDFQIERFEKVKNYRLLKGYDLTYEISKELYDKYEGRMDELIYGEFTTRRDAMSLRILNEPTPLVIDESIQEIIDFLEEDQTEEMDYTEKANKIHIIFARELSKNASNYNLSIGSALLSEKSIIDENENYALNYFQIDDHLYFIDPQTDTIIVACDIYDQGYQYIKLWPDGYSMPIYRSGSRVLRPDINLDETCD